MEKKYSKGGIIALCSLVYFVSYFSRKDFAAVMAAMILDNIIDKQVDSKTYSLSPLTFQDIDIIKNVFKTRLMAIYHTRISYPKENRKS